MKNPYSSKNRIYMSRTLLQSIVAFFLLSGLAAPNYAADGHDVLLDSAVAGPQRSTVNRARDIYRHPVETLLFFGIQPTQKVIEIEPGGGWYTEILAPYLREHGTLYAAPYLGSTADPSPAQQQEHQRYAQKLMAAPQIYDKVTVGTLRAGVFENIAPAGGADLVVTFRNIHNWIKDGHLDDNLRGFYAALKPGGVFGVEEHRGNPGLSVAQMIKTGYVTQDYVIERARAAGFVFVGSSEINANPRDTKDYADGVWALPPTLRGSEPNKERVLAIGESDRMTLKFVKPLGK